MTKSTEQYWLDLKEAVDAKETSKVLVVIDAMYQDCLNGGVCVDWITDPPTFQKVKQLLTDGLGVHPRTMQLRNRIPNRTRRAVTFCLALKNGVMRTAK